MEPKKLNESSPLRYLKGRWAYATEYGLLLLIALLLQMSPFGLPKIAGVRPLLLIPLTVFAAMFEGPLPGGVFGAVAGFLWGVFAQRLLGFDALILMAVGVTCGLLVQLLLRNNWLSALLLAGGATLLHSLLVWLFGAALWTPENAWYVLWRLTLPAVLYTLVLSPALYGVTYWIARHMKRTDD